MRSYKIYILDKFTMMPLAHYDVKAWTKKGAKRWVLKNICEGDTSYLLTAVRTK